MDQSVLTLSLFALGMLAMIVPALLLAFFTRDRHSSDAS